MANKALTERSLKLVESVMVLRASADHVSRRVIEEDFGVKKWKIAHITRNKQSILRKLNRLQKGLKAGLFGTNLDNKVFSSTQMIRKAKGPLFPDVDDAVAIWISKTRNPTTLNSVEIRSKAVAIARNLGITNFAGSDRWLKNFMKREALTLYHRISTDVSDSKVKNFHHGRENIVNQWKKDLPSLIKGYRMEDVFNLDEVGLFYSPNTSRTMIMSKKSLSLKNTGRKRITLLMGVNATGSEKLCPLIIARSRWASHQNKKSKSMKWTTTGWMTSSLFKEYLIRLNNYLGDRHIVLFLDQSRVHPQDLNLSNIKIIFFPAGTTSLLQPMDMGIFKAFKRFYKKKLSDYLNTCFTKNARFRLKNEATNIRHAIKWTHAAWNDVTPLTIVKSFREAGFNVVESRDRKPSPNVSLERLLPRPSKKEQQQAFKTEQEESLPTLQEMNAAMATLHDFVATVPMSSKTSDAFVSLEQFISKYYAKMNNC